MLGCHEKAATGNGARRPRHRPVPVRRPWAPWGFRSCPGRGARRPRRGGRTAGARPCRRSVRGNRVPAAPVHHRRPAYPVDPRHLRQEHPITGRGDRLKGGERGTPARCHGAHRPPVHRGPHHLQERDLPSVIKGDAGHAALPFVVDVHRGDRGHPIQAHHLVEVDPTDAEVYRGRVRAARHVPPGEPAGRGGAPGRPHGPGRRRGTRRRHRGRPGDRPSRGGRPPRPSATESAAAPPTPRQLLRRHPYTHRAPQRRPHLLCVGGLHHLPRPQAAAGVRRRDQTAAGSPPPGRQRHPQPARSRVLVVDLTHRTRHESHPNRTSPGPTTDPWPEDGDMPKNLSRTRFSPAVGDGQCAPRTRTRGPDLPRRGHLQRPQAPTTAGGAPLHYRDGHQRILGPPPGRPCGHRGPRRPSGVVHLGGGGILVAYWRLLPAGAGHRRRSAHGTGRGYL